MTTTVRRARRLLALAGASTLALGLGTVALEPAEAAPPGTGQASFPYLPDGAKQQPFTVPAGVCTLAVEVHGAQGGRATFEGAVDGGGLGSTVTARLAVVPGQTLFIVPGGKGGDTTWEQRGGPGTGLITLPGGTGGYNGGGSGGPAVARSTAEAVWMGGGAGGGGASDIRTSPSAADRVVVAGGGGGSGIGVLPPQNTSTDYLGGAGGLPATAGGGQAPTVGGGGGTPTGGGAAGSGGFLAPTAGSVSAGGDGGSGVDTGDLSDDGWVFGGGGGGGGRYGGGGGGAWPDPTGNGVSAGGGGGSSDTSAAASSVTVATGTRAGDGLVELGWDVEPGCDVEVPVVHWPAVATATALVGGGAWWWRRRRPGTAA